MTPRVCFWAGVAWVYELAQTLPLVAGLVPFCFVFCFLVFFFFSFFPVVATLRGHVHVSAGDDACQDMRVAALTRARF